MLGLRLPAFSLQPIVENAIKYGISQLLEPGTVVISARRNGDVLTVMVEDSAGLYEAKRENDGLGMNLVDRRIKLRYGAGFGLEVTCEPECWTRVAIRLPIDDEHAPC